MIPKHAKPRVRLRASMLTPVALLVSSALVYQASNAAFTATTVNPDNSWAAGSLNLTDNDSGSALFSVANMAPGKSETKCIKVDYTATVTSKIRLYVNSSPDTGLDPVLKIKVEEGTGGGGFEDCTGFTPNPVTALFDGTLANFRTTYTNHSNGLSTWAPSGTDARTYRFTYTFDAGADNSYQGKKSTANFVWEAQSS